MSMGHAARSGLGYPRGLMTLHRFFAVLFAFALVLTLGACSNRGRTRAPVDGGAARVDSGTPPPLTDGGPIGFDSGRPPGFDGGRPGFDGGRPGFDGGLPFPTDGGFPFPTEGGLPFGDAGLPICMAPTDCPSGQMCCELLPGIGFCMATCSGGFP
jgi:hypothetical protein